MINQRRCPCCVGKEPDYRQHIEHRPGKVLKTRKVEREQHLLEQQQLRQQQLQQRQLQQQHQQQRCQQHKQDQQQRHRPIYSSDESSAESEGKPYAYLGEGEIWANAAFMKILQKKYGHGGQTCYHHSPCPSPRRHASAMRQYSPNHMARVSSPVHFIRCSPSPHLSPVRTVSPAKRRSPSPCRRRRTMSPTKIGCTYRVSPIKSKSEIRDGDLIIETSNHKYLKVLGPEDSGDGDDFFVLIDSDKKSRRRAKSSSSSVSTSSSDVEEEVYVAKTIVPPAAGLMPNRFRCCRLRPQCICVCCPRCYSGQRMTN